MLFYECRPDSAPVLPGGRGGTGLGTGARAGRGAARRQA